MTAPTAPAPLKLGPGWLRFGPTATAVDASCYTNSATIEPSVDVGEVTWKLCGSDVPGTVIVTATMSVNLDLDPSTGGVFEYLATHAGQTVPFTFLPHGTRDASTGVVTPTTGVSLEARGQLVVVPMPFGGDTYGATMTGDVSFTLAGTGVDFYRDATKAFTMPLGPVTGTVAADALADAAEAAA